MFLRENIIILILITTHPYIYQSKLHSFGYLGLGLRIGHYFILHASPKHDLREVQILSYTHNVAALSSITSLGMNI
jgi:hypothetical protein